MNKVSIAGAGLVVLLIEMTLRILNITVPDGSVSDAMNGLITVVGFVLLVWGQLRRKDLHFGIIHKD